MPHVDTLDRVLEKLDVDALLSAHLALIKRFIRGKKFPSYLIQNCHPIAIDGTQKLVRDGHWWGDNDWIDRAGHGPNNIFIFWKPIWSFTTA